MPTPALRLSPLATPEWKRVQPLSRGLVPGPKPCVEVSPTISSRNRSASRTSSGSFPNREVTFHVPRASFSSRRSDRQGVCLRLLPSSHCTRPPWPLPRVVSPSEGGPTSCVRALPDRAPWAQARPPGARCRAPPPALAPGGGPGDPRPCKGKRSKLFVSGLMSCSLSGPSSRICLPWVTLPGA